MTAKKLKINEKNFSLSAMEHWVHQRIVDIIKSGTKTRQELAIRLDMSEKTLQRRMADGSWTLLEILGIEAIYGVSLINASAKNDHDVSDTWPDDKMDSAHKPLPYKINVEIDMANFNPQDIQRLNDDLTATMLYLFKKQHGEL